MKEEPYIAISCTFYDQLLALASTKEKCKLIYKSEGKEYSCEGKIIDIFTQKKEEYLLLENSLKIRLDRIISVNNKPYSNLSSSCGKT